jgi:hypothetical protein
MRRLILAGTAAIALSGMAFSGTANAQTCTWTGYSWSCPPTQYTAPGYYAPYAYPNDPYYSSTYKPAWLPSYPGPKPSTGAFR